MTASNYTIQIIFTYRFYKLSRHDNYLYRFHKLYRYINYLKLNGIDYLNSIVSMLQSIQLKFS